MRRRVVRGRAIGAATRAATIAVSAAAVLFGHVALAAAAVAGVPAPPAAVSAQTAGKAVTGVTATGVPAPGGPATGSDASALDRPPRMMTAADIQREMGQARGRTLFVHVWATWCGPCLDELELMNDFARVARAQGAVVLSVSIDSDRRAMMRVPSLLTARAPGLTPIVAVFDDPAAITAVFSPSWEGTIPAMFVFDRAGKLQKGLIGEVESTVLDALLAAIPPAQKGKVKAKGTARAPLAPLRPPAPEPVRIYLGP